MSRVLYIIKSKTFGFLLDTVSENPAHLKDRAQNDEVIPVIVKRHCQSDTPDAIGYAVGGVGRTILSETLRETEHGVRQCLTRSHVNTASRSSWRVNRTLI